MHEKIGRGKKCWCINCKKLYHHEYSKKWETKNKDKRLARQKTEQYKTKRKEWVDKTNQTEKRREYHRNRYQDKKVEMRKIMDKWRAANLDIWNGYGRKRRATMRGLLHEPYRGLEIYERDKGICGICKQFIDMKYKWPHIKSFSIDHIIPIALGGDDTPTNVQASHFGCNAGKAHRV